MVKESPWQYYAVAIVSIIALYYLWVAWKFYQQEIKEAIKFGRPRRRQAVDPPLDELDSDEESIDEKIEAEGELPAWQNEQLFADVEKLAEHLIVEIEEAHRKDYTRQDLIQMLQIILKEYPTLKGTPFQIAVNNRIEAECAKYGSIHLSEGDKREVWSMV